MPNNKGGNGEAGSLSSTFFVPTGCPLRVRKIIIAQDWVSVKEMNHDFCVKSSYSFVTISEFVFSLVGFLDANF